MKLPNGYGSVSKLSGNRRRPYMVRKNSKVIGYAETRSDALSLLAEYNKEPWDVGKRKTTFKEVFAIWKEQKSGKYAEGTVKGYESAYRNYCQALYDVPYHTLRLHDFQSVIDGCRQSNSIKNRIRKLLRQLDKVAFEYEITDRQYTELLECQTEEVGTRKPFTEEELRLVLDHKNDPGMDLVLVLLYTGFRREELVKLTVDSVDLDKWTITGGSKTKAGKDRVVPVHPRIRPIIKDWVEKAKNGRLYPYSGKTLRNHFRKALEGLGIDHVPHECRHTLRTRLDDAGANKKCIDMILGHASKGTGERVYTHKTIEQLHEAMAMID